MRTSDGEVYNLPETLVFNYPVSKTEVDLTHTVIQEDELKQYRQLVCWCLIQRYWYYVICEPKVEDSEYDLIEEYIKELEECISHSHRNPYSPTKNVGSDIVNFYPASIQLMFYAAGRESLKKRLMNIKISEDRESKSQKNLFDGT